MPKFFSGLGVHRWLIFVGIGIAFVVMANGNVLAMREAASPGSSALTAAVCALLVVAGADMLGALLDRRPI